MNKEVPCDPWATIKGHIIIAHIISHNRLQMTFFIVRSYDKNTFANYTLANSKNKYLRIQFIMLQACAWTHMHTHTYNAYTTLCVCVCECVCECECVCDCV